MSAAALIMILISFSVGRGVGVENGGDASVFRCKKEAVI